MTSYFRLPIIGTGTRKDPRRAKYLNELGINFSITDEGATCVAKCETTPEQDAALAAMPDVEVLP